ncbi:hypothetical protein EAI_00087 [Harpegnathos saltator]|uniref:Uncharacterized protein n=1 Tax=Harpegnathos saltator TaxID=610380 RepID=E2BLI9_HARSA|nr:hypothetical protein EAI_00087 [Harpegnathos saltator]
MTGPNSGPSINLSNTNDRAAGTSKEQTKAPALLYKSKDWITTNLGTIIHGPSFRQPTGRQVSEGTINWPSISCMKPFIGA